MAKPDPFPKQQAAPADDTVELIGAGATAEILKPDDRWLLEYLAVDDPATQLPADHMRFLALVNTPERIDAMARESANALFAAPSTADLANSRVSDLSNPDNEFTKEERFSEVTRAADELYGRITTRSDELLEEEPSAGQPPPVPDFLQRMRALVQQQGGVAAVLFAREPEDDEAFLEWVNRSGRFILLAEEAARQEASRGLIQWPNPDIAAAYLRLNMLAIAGNEQGEEMPVAKELWQRLQEEVQQRVPRIRAALPADIAQRVAEQEAVDRHIQEIRESPPSEGLQTARGLARQRQQEEDRERPPEPPSFGGSDADAAAQDRARILRDVLQMAPVLQGMEPEARREFEARDPDNYPYAVELAERIRGMEPEAVAGMVSERPNDFMTLVGAARRKRQLDVRAQVPQEPSTLATPVTLEAINATAEERGEVPMGDRYPLFQIAAQELPEDQRPSLQDVVKDPMTVLRQVNEAVQSRKGQDVKKD